ncbi:MAG: ribonuclease E/G [Verrucomicrobia bacterium]|nr:ribonuclease E/G [Verrucomicrobiota bacterium]
MEEILLNVENREMRCAYLSCGRLYDLIVERQRTRQVRGNIYRGTVKNILTNIQSAFIDIGGENGFIHISDVLENAKKLEQLFDIDFEYESAEAPETENADADIKEVLVEGQAVLVQVVKEPIGNKGARLTARISLPGRYLVLLPNMPHYGVSRKIEERNVRERLKRILRSFDLPKGVGLICRTASQFATEDALCEEAQGLLQLWEQIRSTYQRASGPCLLYEESDLIKRTLLHAFDLRVDRLLIDNYNVYKQCKEMTAKYTSEHPLRIEYYRDKVPMFERFNVEREIDKALSQKVWLPGGGYLYFDQTEAMHTIDVNSGRSGGKEGKDVEESLVQINLDAVDEIARQLRIRNIGGLIICDFIDMRSRKNRKRVLDHLRDRMKDDPAKCTILGMSEFGLVEMTRQRSRESLAQTLFEDCPYCFGRGGIKNSETMSIEIERTMRKIVLSKQHFGLRLKLHPHLYNYLKGEDVETLYSAAQELNAEIELIPDETLHLNDVRFTSSITGEEFDA